MLDGLDAVDWAALGGASGSAVRVPDLLRAIASGVEPDADDAVGDLVNEVFHQHTVWTCTDPAVPFVVELALEPSVPHRSSLVYLLASLSYEGVKAVGPHVPRLVALLDDADPDVREFAAYLVAWHHGHAASTVPVLARRWDEESEPLVRASVLAALGALDRESGRSRAERALREPDPALRAAAVLVLLWMRNWWSEDDVPLPPDALGAVASAFADGDPLDGWAWSDNAQSEVLEGLEGVPGARDVMLTALVRSPSADTRRHTVYEIQDRNRSSRSAPARLVPLLGPLLSDQDPTVRRVAAMALRRAGVTARLVADDLAMLAGTLPPDGAPPPGAESALATLIELGDARWRPTLLAAWRRPPALDEAAGALRTAAPPADADLLTAVSDRIAAMAAAGQVGDEVDALAAVVSRWEDAAASSAAPALTAALQCEVATERPTPGAICVALAGLGPAAYPAVPALRVAATRSFHGHDRVQAALAVWRLTGDPGPALEVGAVLLDGTNGYDESRQVWLYPETVAHLIPLGPDLAPLEPRLRRHLVEFPERHGANCDIARVLWRLGADPDGVLPVLRAGLSFTYLGKPGPPGSAVRAAAELGEHATPLLDLLRRALDAETGWVRAAAAATLVRLGAGDPAELVAVMVPEPRPYHRWQAFSALEALDVVAELRLAQAVPRLDAWLATDARVQADESDAVRLDERFQARAREVVAALS